MTKGLGSILLVIAVLALVNVTQASTITYYSNVYSEIKSNWDQSKNVYVSADGVNEATLTNYTPVLDVGFFQVSGDARAEFGHFGYSGSFQLSLPTGSNVALSTDVNGIVSQNWVINPLSLNTQMTDQITVNGSAPSYDLVFPFYIEGSFSKSGTPNCDIPGNPLGLTGEVDTYVRISSKNPSYRQMAYLNQYDGQYAPGRYDLILRGVPSNLPLSITFNSSFSFMLADTEQIKTDPVVNWSSHPEQVVITNTLVHRTDDWYSLEGAADFGHTVSFGSFAAYRDGVRMPDVTITSSAGATYPAAIPEPGSLFLLGGGLGLLGLIAWRKRT